jgi:hypothetical protein
MKRLGQDPEEPLSNIVAPPENTQQPANNLGIDDATLRQIQKQFLNETVEIPEQLF